MCLALSLKVVEIKGNEAIGEMNGIRRNIRVDLLSKVKVGDYVMVHAGFALDVIQEELAKETMKAIEEVYLASK